jgi:ACS family tartrate transporter-like MFS transporter
MMGPFWTLTTSMLGGTAMAGAVAILQIIGGLGGFAGPYMTGRLRDASNGFTGGLYVISAMAFAAALLTLAVRKPKPQDNPPANA